ncbi:tetratricopeptide repeat protein, partial [Escherichia coli]|nr:tetratricopeptide repeat protein [Escherichia coli]
NGNIARAEKVERTLDPARLDAEIERLEQEAAANPGDDDVRIALARAYLARANARRAAGQLQAALKDYSTALRYDPDNA